MSCLYLSAALFLAASTLPGHHLQVVARLDDDVRFRLAGPDLGRGSIAPHPNNADQSRKPAATNNVLGLFIERSPEMDAETADTRMSCYQQASRQTSIASGQGNASI